MGFSPPPSRTLSQLEIRPLPRPLGERRGPRARSGARRPGVPGVFTGPPPGVRPGRGRSGRPRARAAGSPAHGPSAGATSRTLAAGKRHLARTAAASRVPAAAAKRPRSSPAAQPRVTLQLLAARPSVFPAAVRQSQEPRRQDERGVPVVGTGSRRDEGKDSGEEPGRLRPLPPPVPPTPGGSGGRRGRVPGMVATGAQRSPPARRLSSGTQRAGLVTSLRVHVNTVGRRSPALPPPNHRSRRAGGGRAGSQPLPRAPAAGARPPAPARPRHVRRGRREAPVFPERAPGPRALPARPPRRPVRPPAPGGKPRARREPSGAAGGRARPLRAASRRTDPPPPGRPRS